jgi:hypothetical protein
MHYTRHIAPVTMVKPGTARTVSASSGRLRDGFHYGIPALIGLLMFAWGMFLNSSDRLLAIAGLALFLGFGWYAYRAFTGKTS